MSKIVVCHYTAKPGREADLEALLLEHGRTLAALGLKRPDVPTQLLRGLGEGKPHAAKGKYIEIFAWAGDDSMQRAHEAPEVMRVWEGIGDACSSMDFPDFESFGG